MGETLNAMKISLLLIGCNYQLVFHLLQEESHTVGLYHSISSITHKCWQWEGHMHRGTDRPLIEPYLVRESAI